MNKASLDEKAIFHAALALAEPAERQALLDRACQDDSRLRVRVQRLLTAHEHSGDLLEQSAAEREIAAPLDRPTETTGTAIGRYKLLEQIGEGGFGVVYMAEQVEPIRRRVALKLIKVGMDTNQVVARFEVERQALALMEHPNIAKVLDAGATETGRPYFVMELVRGSPIIEYCDERNFSTEQRLTVFIQVCSAVQHAHQKGIIHRDIKPSNILVSTDGDEPVPKVIDFGIAKAAQGNLTDKTLFTQYRQFVGTPAYMSPEQAQMSPTDVDTRSDIYSLGVLLYELLTGKTPFDSQELLKAGFDEVCRRIREEDAPTPSKRVSSLQSEELKTLAQNRRVDPAHFSARFRGDLDWIVVKAVERDRARRYTTADALAEDIRRHLCHEPVSAAPPHAWYILKRLARRNRRLLVTASLIAAALVVGTLTSTWQAILATKATAKATAAGQDAMEKTRLAIAYAATMRRNLYATELAAAKATFDQMGTQPTVELLAKYVPLAGQSDLRGFEWRWLWNQCDRELFQLRINPNGVNFRSGWDRYRDMRFSLDGRWLATGSTDGAVRLWNFERRQEVWQFMGGLHCNAVDFSPDGRLLLANFFDPAGAGTLIWEITNPTAPVQVGQSTSGVRFWSDGKTIVGHDGARYDLSGKVVEKPYIDAIPGEYMRMQTYSKDWATLASKDCIWDVPNRTLLARLPRHAGYIDAGPNGIAISPVDSNLIATGSAEGICIWGRRGNLIRTLAGTGGSPVAWLDFSKTGDLLAVRLAIGAVRVFETETWAEVETVPVRPGNSLLFSPVANNLLVAGGDDGVIRTYRVSASERPDVTFQHPTELSAMKFSPDGRILAVGMLDGAVRFWDVHTRRKRFTTPPTQTDFVQRPFETSFGPDYVAFSPDSRFAAVIGPEPTVSVWDIEDQEIVASYTCEKRKGIYRNEYYAVCFSRRRISDSVVERSTRRHDTERGEAEFSSPSQTLLFGAVRGAMIGDDSGLAVTNKFNSSWRDYGHIDVWDWPDRGGKLRLVSEHPGRVKCLDASLDGCLLAGSQMYRDRPLVWKLPEMKRLSNVSSIGNWAIKFSTDGLKLALCGRQVKLWDMQQWRQTAVLPHVMRVEHISWSPDGTRLAASDIIGNTKLWDVESQQVVATFRGTISAFSPDGTILAVGGPGSKYTGDEQDAGLVTLRYAPPLQEIDRRMKTSRVKSIRRRGTDATTFAGPQENKES